MTNYRLLGNKISEARNNKSLSQEALAECTNISLSTIQRIEKGHVKPRAYTLKTITEALDLSLPDLLEKCNQATNELSNTLIKKINLSTFYVLLFPLLNIIIPLIFWKRNKGSDLENNMAGKVISFQIIWTIFTIVILFSSSFIVYFFTGIGGYRPINYEIAIYVFMVFLNICTTLKITHTINSNKKEILKHIPNLF